MDVNIESPGGLRRQITVRIPADQVSREVEARLKRYSKRAKIPGFRPGKAPAKVIQQQFGASARAEAVTELVQRSYPEALGQSGLNPAGAPQISVTAEKPGEALEYTAAFEVYPEIQLQNLDQIKIDRPTVEITDADIDRLIANLQKARRGFNTVERSAAEGDVVLVDFEGKLDGEPFQGGKAEKSTIEIGSGQMLPDLENGLIGHGAGETFVVDVAFPADYRATELAGKTAQFDVTVHEVREVVLPPVDDAEFLEAHGVGNVDELRTKSRTALENERNKAIRARVKTQALDQLLSLNPVEVPESLIAQEIPRLRRDAAARMNLPNIPDERLEQLMPATMFEENARKRTALGLLVGEVLSSRQIKLDPTRVEQSLTDIAADYEQPDEVRTFYRERPELMQSLSAAVLEEQVVESLTAEISVTDVPMSLEELLAQRQS